MFGDLDPGNVGRDRLKLPADFRRRVHLQIENVLMRGPAWQEDHDHRLVRSAHARRRLRAQDLRETQTPKRQSAYTQKITTRKPIAKCSLEATVDGKHGLN